MQGSALENRKKVALFEYDFAKDGGAVGDITLRGPSLPAGAVIDKNLIQVKTAFTSGGSATVALTLKTAGDMYAAGAISGLTAGVKAGVADGTASNAIVLTANTTPVLTVAVAALTAGKLVVMVEYFVTA